MRDEAENGSARDDSWNTKVEVIIKPDERLDKAQRAIIEVDFGITDEQLEVPSRRALVKHVLKHDQINSKNLNPNPEAQQIVDSNLKELKPWLYE